MEQHQMIAERIRFYRMARGWSQTQLADKLCTTQCLISNTEHAKAGSWIDSLDKLRLIAETLEINLSELIFGGMVMENYKNVPMTWVTSGAFICGYDDLIVAVDDAPEEVLVNAFYVTARCGGKYAGMISGLYTNAYTMFTQPGDVFKVLSKESRIYEDAAMAYFDKVLPQMTMGGDSGFNLPNKEINNILKKAERSMKAVNDVVNDLTEGEDEYYNYYTLNQVVFFNDIIVYPDYRQHGILTKMLNTLGMYFGKSYSGVANLYPVKPDEYGLLVDDDDNVKNDLQRNRIVAEKLGWVLTDDFVPSAAAYNTYALKLPDYILRLAELGEEFRKYVPHKTEEPRQKHYPKARRKTHEYGVLTSNATV